MDAALLTAAEISPVVAERLARLLVRVYPAEKTVGEMTAHILAYLGTLENFRAAVIENDEEILAVAAGVTRLIRHGATGDAEKVIALFAVATHPQFRGRGYGAAAVKAQFARAGHDAPSALWQTAVPVFYEKIGAVRVRNRFVNSRNLSAPDANPFWEPAVMVYPPAAWRDHDEVIDLLGAGY
ncbi:MAG: GNAT family N-acetyltransferase [Planctomycetota bacterium]|jgi:GNAT superfamily N-acetyltransferase|nr:GNAT family N-acetyltransferase [Planctomycetota bacterium]